MSVTGLLHPERHQWRQLRVKLLLQFQDKFEDVPPKEGEGKEGL